MKTLPSAVALTLVALAVPAQKPARRPEPPVMYATDKYLFVLRDGVLHKFDVETMKLLKSVELPAPAAGGIAPRVAEKRGRSQRRPAPVPQAKVPAPPMPPAMRPEKAKDSVRMALQWMARHQDADGRWDADAFTKHDPAGSRKPKGRDPGLGNGLHDVGITGLALLALLADGSTMFEGTYHEAVARGVDWLCKQQAPSGVIGTAKSQDFIYDHTIATAALCQAFAVSNATALRGPAQDAIDYLERHRNPYLVWRYQPRDNDNDTSVTSWALQAYATADAAGLNVNKQALMLAKAWLDQVTDPNTGRAGYTKRGEPSARLAGNHAKRFPPDLGEALTAAALFDRFLLGQDPTDTAVMRTAADRLLARPPSWDPETGGIDLYYWYYGSRALYRMGGQHADRWGRWLSAALIPNQVRGGADDGSWDPIGVWGEVGGRVYATALAALALQSHASYFLTEKR